MSLNGCRRWLLADRPNGELSGSVPYLVGFPLIFSYLLLHGLGREGDISTLLHGPDDFMRLVQVIDWLDGQDWSDMVQRRLNPPAGVSMHWSRLADIPTAAVVWLTEPWFGRDRAVYLSALLVPPLLGGLFAVAFLWASTCLLSGRDAHVSLLMLGTPLYPFLRFHPGRIDHHGLQLVLTALSIGLLIRALESDTSRAAVGLGIVGGVSLAIGLESLPFLGGATVVLGLAWVLRGGTVAARLAMFGLAATGTVLALLPLTLPQSEWTAIACDRMSIVHGAMIAIVLVAGGVAVALERLRPMATRFARLVAAGGIGIVGLAVVAIAFPECAGSPYANLSAEVRYWFDAVEETQALLDLFRQQPGVAVSIIALPLATLALLALQRTEAGGRTEMRQVALLVLVLSSVALVAWQIRGAAYAGLVASLALVPFAAAVNMRANRLRRMPARVGLRLCVPIICIAVIVLPQRLPQLPSSLAADERESGCKVRSVFAALNDPAGLGTESRIIAAPIDLGPRILLLTRHEVLAAPYHRNTQGLADNRRIFAGSEEEALVTVRERDVGAILFCREYVPVTTYADHPAFLNERLGADRPPWWLIPITHNKDGGLYWVHPAARAIR